MKVLVHLVTWNSEATIRRCLEQVFFQEGFTLGVDLFVRITDNASTDSTVSIVERLCNREGVSLCGHYSRVAYALHLILISILDTFEHKYLCTDKHYLTLVRHLTTFL